MKELKSIFEEEYGKNDQPLQCFFAPGRVNLIGEHIDYNGGYVFPAALSLGIYGLLRPRSDQTIQLKSTNASVKIYVDLLEPILYTEEDGWGNYPKGVIKSLQDRGYSLGGYDILFSGNLPDGAGLSSSAALLVLTTYMLRWAAGDKDMDRAEIALFSQKVENEFIKVNCGIMDQFAVAMGQEDCAILLDCETLTYKHIPCVLGEYSLVIMNTNKKRELAESNYNQRRDECEQALAIIRQHRSVANLCQALPKDITTYLDDDLLRRRANHVVSENRRVILASQLLEQGNLIAFGKVMTESHLSLKNNYEVTGPELDSIVEQALGAPGCIGARMTGAGFGGCAIALVESSKLQGFQRTVAKGYNKTTGLTPDFYEARIADGVKVLEY